MLKTAGMGVAAVLLFVASSAAGELPDAISKQLPPGYVVLGSASASVGAGRQFYFVALRSRSEPKSFFAARSPTPARPLLIFERRPDRDYVLAGRNDDVILHLDDAGLAGNGCDPFEDHHITVRGPYFTVEHFVSCGAHWTDNVTFRFDSRMESYVFDNWRFQSLKFNPNQDPNAQALIPDVRSVVRAPKGRAIPFDKWRRPRD